MTTTILLDSEAMISLWKTRMGLDEPRTDCAIVRSSGPDIDAFCLQQARSWYVQALRSMPPCCLPLTDIYSLLTPASSTQGVAGFRLPSGCLRVVHVSADRWLMPATVVESPEPSVSATMANPYSRPGEMNPVALVSGNLLLVAPEPMESLHVEAVMLTSDESFLLTPDMIANMPITTS